VIITRSGSRALQLAALITREGHRSRWSNIINARSRELGLVVEWGTAVQNGWLR
jgi:hypothetical protein